MIGFLDDGHRGARVVLAHFVHAALISAIWLNASPPCGKCEAAAADGETAETPAKWRAFLVFTSGAGGAIQTGDHSHNRRPALRC